MRRHQHYGQDWHFGIEQEETEEHVHFLPNLIRKLFYQAKVKRDLDTKSHQTKAFLSRFFFWSSRCFYWPGLPRLAFPAPPKVVMGGSRRRLLNIHKVFLINGQTCVCQFPVPNFWEWLYFRKWQLSLAMHFCGAIQEQKPLSKINIS